MKSLLSLVQPPKLGSVWKRKFGGKHCVVESYHSGGVFIIDATRARVWLPENDLRKYYDLV